MSEHYVNNADFQTLLVEYKTTKSRKTYEKIGAIILKISQRMGHKLNFINYSQDRKNEFQSLACLYCLRYLKNYDAEKYKNPFSYFSQICFNAYLQVIATHKKRDETFLSLENSTSKDNVYASEHYHVEEE